jgi:hypothetical protein
MSRSAGIDAPGALHHVNVTVFEQEEDGLFRHWEKSKSIVQCSWTFLFTGPV